MFKLRPGGQGTSSPSQPPNIEAIRRSARHRLIGALVLVLAGVLGFPLLFDSQPRPIPVDIPIEIPAKQAGKTLGPVQEQPVAAAARLEGLDAKEEVLAPAAVVPKAVDTAPATPIAPPTKAPDKSPEAPVSKPVAKEPVKQPVKDAAKAAQKEPPKDAAQGRARLVVQVGAFADAARAREVRQKLERAGLKTYVHVADTPDGKRTRVRLGPFDSREEADKAAARAKALGLSGNVLAL